MLKELCIENIAIVKKECVEFPRGFSVLTGETGAGKSIVIDSIGLIMGARSSKELIRSGEKSASVTALFSDFTEADAARLAEMGFSILEERYTKSSNKYYVCMLAEYTGNVRPLTEWEAELGLIPDDNGGRVEYIGYLKARLSSREKALCGRASGTAEYAAREEIVLMLKKRISEMEELLK